MDVPNEYQVGALADHLNLARVGMEVDQLTFRAITQFLLRTCERVESKVRALKAVPDQRREGKPLAQMCNVLVYDFLDGGAVHEREALVSKFEEWTPEESAISFEHEPRFRWVHLPINETSLVQVSHSFSSLPSLLVDLLTRLNLSPAYEKLPRTAKST